MAKKKGLRDLLSQFLVFLRSKTPQSEIDDKVHYWRQRFRPFYFYRFFSEVCIALKLNNQAKVNRDIISVLNKDRRLFVFDGSWGEKKILGPLMDEYFVLFDKIKDPLLKKMWLSFWVEFYPEKIKERKEKFGLLWSLTEIREKVGSFYYGIGIGSFWLPYLVKRTAFKEVQEFVDKTNFFPYNKSLWIYEYFWPEEGPLLSRVSKLIMKDWSGQDYTKQWTVLLLLRNDSLRNYLSLQEKEFKRPLFNINRHYFHKLLESGLARDFSLYNLILLGDIGEKFVRDLWRKNPKF